MKINYLVLTFKGNEGISMFFKKYFFNPIKNKNSKRITYKEHFYP